MGLQAHLHPNMARQEERRKMAQVLLVKALSLGPRAPGSGGDSAHFRREMLKQVVNSTFHRGEVGEAA